MPSMWDNPLKFRRIDVRPANGTIGAEIRDVDAGFLNMVQAYESRSPTMRSVGDQLSAVHSATRVYGSACQAQDKRFSASSVKSPAPRPQ